MVKGLIRKLEPWRTGVKSTEKEYIEKMISSRKAGRVRTKEKFHCVIFKKG